MRFIVGIVFLIALISLITANVSTHFEQDGLSVDRQLVVQPIGGVDTTTGVARTRYISTVTLIITNPGPGERQNVQLLEDLSYFPPYIHLSFSEKPVSAGRTANWTLARLPAGRSASYSITLPALVSDAAVSSAKPPEVTSDRPSAQLTVPSLVDLGQNAVIVLRSNTGSPISDAHIQVIGPDSHPISLVTDPSGRAFFTATQSGFYSYHVLDYRVGFRPTTEVRPAPAPVPSTVGAVVALPSSNTTATTSNFPTIELSGFWPIAGALLMIGIVAFGLYMYFNRPVDEESTPTPPAPATRPSMSDGQRAAAMNASSEPNYLRSSSTSVSDTSGAPLRDSSSSLSPSLSSPDSSRSPSPSASSSGSSPIPTTPSDQVDSENMRQQTRSLISERRGIGGISIVPTRSSPSSLSPSPSSIDWNAKPEVGEETTVAETDSDDSASESSDSDQPSQDSSSASDSASSSSDSDSSSDPTSSPSSDSDSPPSSSTDRAVPSWMTKTPPAGENAEVDDDAIAKTISELEALRDELRSRSSARESHTQEDESNPSESSESHSQEDERSSPFSAVSEESALPPEEEAKIDEILSAEPVTTVLAAEEEAEIEQEAESIDTEVKGSDAESSAPSLFTPTPAEAPEHPIEKPRVARKAKPLAPSKQVSKPVLSKSAFKIPTKSKPSSTPLKRGPGRAAKNVKAGKVTPVSKSSSPKKGSKR